MIPSTEKKPDRADFTIFDQELPDDNITCDLQCSSNISEL